MVGHGHFDESWGIEKGIIMGRPDSDETWAALDDVLDKVYRFEDGLGLKLSMSFMDEGGHSSAVPGAYWEEAVLYQGPCGAGQTLYHPA